MEHDVCEVLVDQALAWEDKLVFQMSIQNKTLDSFLGA